MQNTQLVKEINMARGISNVQMDDNYIEFMINEFNTCSFVKLAEYYDIYESEKCSGEFVFSFEKWLGKIR